MKKNLNRNCVIGMALLLAPVLSQAATYGATAIVAQSGGDYTSPVAAMADVGTWCGTPADANRCLVKVMPGTYDISGSVLSMQSWVDILGSGENNTVITGSGTLDSGSPILVRAKADAVLGEMTVHMVQTPGTVVVMNDGQLRDMTVSYLVGGATTGVVIASGKGLLERVKIRGSGHGWMQGLYAIYNSTVTLRDVDVQISPSNTVYNSTCVGIYTRGGTSDMNTVNAECRDATDQNNSIRSYGTKATMRNVTALSVGGTIAAAILLRQLYGEQVYLERVSAQGYRSAGTSAYGLKHTGTGAGTSYIRNSSLIGSESGMLNIESADAVLTNSSVTGGVNVLSGSVVCGGNTDDAGVFYAAACP